MLVAERIESLLPYLRRYARASTGSAKTGDACVERVLQSVLIQSLDADSSSEDYTRVRLFSLLDAELHIEAACQSAQARRALLLIAVEGFDEPTARKVMSVDRTELKILLDLAERAFAETKATSLLIIEDEPLIAAQLKRIAESLGHRVVGVADTSRRAVEMSETYDPDIVLCDIHLADGSLGTDAIKAMNLSSEIPVVFITAYPEQYLSTLNEGPSYLITKPFDAAYLKAVIGHALINVQSA